MPVARRKRISGFRLSGTVFETLCECVDCGILRSRREYPGFRSFAFSGRDEVFCVLESRVESRSRDTGVGAEIDDTDSRSRAIKRGDERIQTVLDFVLAFVCRH